MWKMKSMVMSVVISVFGAILKELGEALEYIRIESLPIIYKKS